MRKSIIITCIVFYCLIQLNSCNDDVFVKELKTSDTELQMNGNGDSATIYINTSDWAVTAIYDTENPMTNIFYGIEYDENGHALEKYKISLLQNRISKGKVIYTGEDNGFTISRKDDNTLGVSVDENILDSTFNFTIVVSDQFKNIPIKIRQSASRGYSLDSITYKYLNNSFHKEWNENKIKINNDKNSDLEYNVYIFSGEYQEILFSSKDIKAFSYIRKTKINIPIGMKDNALQFSTQKNYYNSKKQECPLPFEDIKKTLTIPAGMSTIRIVLEYDYFEAEYTMYIHNKETGEKKEVKGYFFSKMPAKDGYIIFLNDKMII